MKLRRDRTRLAEDIFGALALETLPQCGLFKLLDARPVCVRSRTHAFSHGSAWE